MKRAVRALALAVLVMSSAACSSGGSATTTERSGISASSTSSTPAGSAILTDEDLAELLAVAVPAAIAANPDGAGKIEAIDYTIADSLGSVNGDSVTFPGNEALMTRVVRTAISDAVSPGSALFVPADLTKGMLLIGTPSVEGRSVIVTYQQLCGGEPGALCGSGGAFRMERDADGWRVAEVLSGWIS